MNECIAGHAGPDLVSRMRQWFISNPVEVYWHYDDKLRDDQVDMLLEGKHWEVIDDISEGAIYHNEYHWEQEIECVRNCVREHLDELLGGLEVDEDELGDDDLDIIGEELMLRENVIVNLNEGQLIRNTRVCLVLDLGVEHFTDSVSYYEEAEEALEFFNINPRLMYTLINGAPWPEDDEPWPNLIERRDPYVQPSEMLQSWINMPYYGEYVALLGGLLDLSTLAYAIESAELEGKYLELTLLPGTMIIEHSYWNGSGGLGFRLKREMKVRLTKENQLARDGRFSYGVQDVHGFIGEVWDTPFKFEVKEEAHEVAH